ncbi:MAG: spore cortex biosynthesis protein YabQ [Ruminococcus sp.]|nr:spore cortex biosynthesis protein YabQ [Ruminococcus sp.]
MQLGTAAELDILRDSVIAGVLAGIVYDVFRVIRHTLRFAAVRFVCDLFYALLFGAAFFVFSLDETNYYRGFILFGMIAGAVMWCFTVGRLLSAAAVRLIACVMKIMAFLAKPFVVIFNKSTSFARQMIVKIQPKSEMEKKFLKSS